MTKNKAYNIKMLCRYKGIPEDSLEAQEFKDWSVLQLLNAIQEARELSKQPPPAKEQTEIQPVVVEEEDDSLLGRVGSVY